MKLATLAFGMIGLMACGSADAQRLRTGGTPIPVAASSVGFTTNTFHVGPFSTANTDSTASYASGFKFYPANFFGASPNTSTLVFNADGSVTTNHNNSDLASIGQIASAPNYVGTAFGCGAYFTAEVKIAVTNTLNVGGWPSWWAMAAEHLVSLSGQQWTGQAAGYDHFGELDTFEWDRNSTSYGATLHDHYGLFGTTCSGYCDVVSSFSLGTIKPPNGTDWTIYHRIAALWVPATVSTTGYVTFYFDDIPFSTISWSQFTTQTPPPTSSTPWTYGVFDQQHFALIFGSGATGNPITLKSVDVWQGSGACNITN